MATRKSKTKESTWPKVVTGSHLTVKTYEDGRTELEWDDQQLLKDVQEAIASVKKPAVRAKQVHAKKLANKKKE